MINLSSEYGYRDPVTTETCRSGKVYGECDCGWSGRTNGEIYEIGVERRIEFSCPECCSDNVEKQTI